LVSYLITNYTKEAEMKRKDYILLLVISVISGLIGGFASKMVFDKTAIAQEGQETSLQGQDIRLLSKNGKVLAALAVSPDTGEPFFFINGKDGKYRIMFNIDQGSPQIMLRDNNAQTRMELGATEITNQSKGTIEKRPESSIVMFNKDGKLIWSAP
jgi:hypothetical protein